MIAWSNMAYWDATAIGKIDDNIGIQTRFSL
jgi:hypothetical protein